MNIIFLASLFPKQLEKHFEQYSKGNIHYAGNALQWNFLNGFILNNDEIVNVITAPMIGSFPAFYKKVFVRGSKFQESDKMRGTSIGYCNLAIIKNKFIERALKCELTEVISKNINDRNVIIVYGMHAAYMKAAVYVKNLFPGVKLCLIVPDLPEYYANSSNIIWKVRQLIQEDTYKLLHHFDSFVVLTEAMVEKLNINNKPWVRIEGMVNPEEHKMTKNGIIHNKKIIMYTGTLAIRYGILDLLAAFESIKDKDYELWICGSGETETFIKEKAKYDNRITFYGLIPRDKVLDLQRKATILVNPRKSEGEYTKYSFPSKTMEYLLAGIPVVMYRLPGISDEYNDYIHFVEENSINSFKNKIVEVCELDSTSNHNFGQNAMKFVLKEKNNLVQTKKVLKMVATCWQ